jgi:hypothetical protein
LGPMRNHFTPNQMALILSAEHIGWEGLCGLIKRNWPHLEVLVDTAMEQTDADVRAANGDPETASEYPAYYAKATLILRGLLTLSLGLL